MGLYAQDRPAEANVLRIGLLTAVGANPQSGSIERGVRLGAAEASQTAKLFGHDVELYEASAGSDAIASAIRLSSARKVHVLIGTAPADIDALSKFADQHHIVFFNAASRAQSLRAACRRYTFHVEGSAAMYANAALLGRGPAVVSGRASPTPAATDSVVLWGSTLERYGAAQINDRYRAKYGVGMDGAAWAGWAAVKIASEAALRARSSEPAQLLAYLESPSTFDGHKGWPLSVRSADHQLRQPLYIVTPAQASSVSPVFRDVPELRASSQERSEDETARLTNALDRLIASPTATRCHWSNR
jgi:ABC-type branched-subunit amino acid transport system substrate-binding protein